MKHGDKFNFNWQGVQVEVENVIPDKDHRDEVDLMMSYEQGELSDEEAIVFFQRILNSGLVWQLQGHYGRTAKALIRQGYITETQS